MKMRWLMLIGLLVVAPAHAEVTTCSVERGTPLAVSPGTAIEARNGIVASDTENLKAMVVGRQLTVVPKTARARVIREDSLWVHSADEKKAPTDADAVWVLDYGLGHRPERDASKPMRLFRIRLLEGDLMGVEGWIAARFCLQTRQP